MATETIITLIDSINGSTEGVETVTFFHPMTGQKMTIELDEANRKAMGTHLQRMSKYFDAAEVVEEPVAASKSKAAAKNTETTKIREWARKNEFTIGDRGRISADIMAAYAAAHEQIDSAEAETSVDPLDEGTFASDNPPIDLNEPDSDEAETQVVDSESDKDYSDDEILAMMAELEANHGEVTEDVLKAKLDESADNE